MTHKKKYKHVGQEDGLQVWEKNRPKVNMTKKIRYKDLSVYLRIAYIAFWSVLGILALYSF